MKLLYILCALMLIGCVLIFFSALKVLDELNSVKTVKKFHRVPRYQQQKPPAASPEMQSYLLAGYVGFTFFIVGSVGAVVVAVQAFNRGF